MLFYTKNNFLHLETFVPAHANLFLHKGQFFLIFSYKVIINNKVLLIFKNWHDLVHVYQILIIYHIYLHK